jgi:hypothetical protein
MGVPPMIVVLHNFDRYPDRIKHERSDLFFPSRRMNAKTPRRQDAEKEKEKLFEFLFLLRVLASWRSSLG